MCGRIRRKERKMKVLIVDWGKHSGDGSQYTLFIVEGTSKQDCFWTIDHRGDPMCCEYKIFDIDVLDEGLQDQEGIAAIYNNASEDEESDGPQTFSKKDLTVAYEIFDQ